MALPPELLTALRTPPRDPERFLVLADRLQAQGDPRGELISIQAARSLEPASQKLQRAEALLFERHARTLLGNLWKSPSSCILDWDLGFIGEAKLWVHEVDPPLPVGRNTGGRQPRRRTGKLRRLTEDLLELESAALLSALTLAQPRSGFQRAALLDAVAVVRRLAPPTLERLWVRDLVQPPPVEHDYDYDYGYPPDPRTWAIPAAGPQHQRRVLLRGAPLLLGADAPWLDELADALHAWEAPT